MRLLRITSAYPRYLEAFYGARPELESSPFECQKAALDGDAFGWADFWTEAMRPLGYDVFEIVANAVPAQRAWARERSLPTRGPSWALRTALDQARWFRPDVLWYDHSDPVLLGTLRKEVPSLRLVLGWVGSWVPASAALQEADVVLSCAPESVAHLRESGCRAEHLHHAFDPRLLHRTGAETAEYGVSFIGQIIRSRGFHERREAVLLELASLDGFHIFSPDRPAGTAERARYLARRAADAGVRALKRLGVPGHAIRKIPLLGMAEWKAPPVLRDVHEALLPRLRPPVFGLEMYSTLRASSITLNVHADSSPRFASNMRLFETTGMGSCLVTDWKENLSELFEVDSEVIAYRSAAECAEVVRWLLDHPTERAAVARAGQRRCLAEHTFGHRALRLDHLIRRELN